MLRAQLPLAPLASDSLVALVSATADLDGAAVARRRPRRRRATRCSRSSAPGRWLAGSASRRRACGRGAGLAGAARPRRAPARGVRGRGRPRAGARPSWRRCPLDRPPRRRPRRSRRGLLVAVRGRVGYRHALLRDAAYAELPDPHRAWLHETFADALRRERLAGAGRRDRPAPAAGRARRAARSATWRAGGLARPRRRRAGPGGRAVLREASELAADDAALLVELAEVEAWRSRAQDSEAAFDRALAADARGAASSRRARGCAGPSGTAASSATPAGS